MEKMAKLKRKQEEGFHAIFGDLEISHLEGTIIASFFPEAEEMTIKEIQERVGYSYERVNSALKSLNEKKIVFEKQKGKTLIYSIDIKNPCSYGLGFIRYMLQRKIHFMKKHKLIYKSIKEISEEIFGIVILFGSYSKGNETENSDIDLMIVSDSEKQAEESVNKIKSTRGFNISLAFVKRTEFPKIKEENLGLWKDLRDYAIVFNGGDIYYSWMYKNG